MLGEDSRASSGGPFLSASVLGALLLSCLAPVRPPLLAEDTNPAVGSKTPSDRDEESDDSRLARLEKRLQRLEDRLDRILEEFIRERQRGERARDEIHYEGKPISEWIRDLGDRSGSVQNHAVDALLKIASDALPDLLAAVEKGDWLRSQNAAIAVLKMHGGRTLHLEEAAPVFGLFRRLSDPSAVARYLGKHQVANEVLDLALRDMPGAHPSVRQGTARLLGAYARQLIVTEDGRTVLRDAASKERLSRAVDALTEGLRDPVATVRMEAIEQLTDFAGLAKPAHGALFSVMDGNEAGEAIAAALALVELKSAETRRIARFLADQLDHEDRNLLTRIVESLGTLGPDALVATAPLVSKILPEVKETADSTVRIEAAIALVKIHPRGAAAWNEHVVDVLIEGLGSGSSEETVEVIEALAALGPIAGKARDVLQGIAKGTIRRVRSTRSRRPSFRPSSTALLREKATQALEKLGSDSADPSGEKPAESTGNGAAPK